MLCILLILYDIHIRPTHHTQPIRIRRHPYLSALSFREEQGEITAYGGKREQVTSSETIEGRGALTKGNCAPPTGNIAKEMGQGVSEGRLRPVLLPLRGGVLERRRVARGQDGRQDEPEGPRQVYPRVRPAGGHRAEARDGRRGADGAAREPG